MKANLLLQRRIVNSGKNTIGNLFFNGIWFCYVLEDTVRELKDINNDGDFDDKNEGKVYGETAIPTGVYKIILNMSNRFKKLLPLLIDVKGYQGIRIHNGSTEAHTHGCLLVGFKTDQKSIWESKIALGSLMEKLKQSDEINICIENKFTKNFDNVKI